jgi:hypothetical protein
MNALADRPMLFQAAIAISPAVTNDQRVGEGSVSLSDRLAETLTSPEALSFALFITMSDGEDGRWLIDFEDVEDVLRASAPEGFSWRSLRLEGEDHGTTVLPSVFQGLRFINADWDTSALVREGTIEDMVSRFRALSERLGHEIQPPEVMVNLLGYRLLGEDRVGEAIEAFEFNVILHPESANVHDSLGEALERRGRLPGAIRCYRTAVRVAEASDDPLLPIFRTNLRRVEARLAGGDDERLVLQPPSFGGRVDGENGPDSGR